MCIFAYFAILSQNFCCTVHVLQQIAQVLLCVQVYLVGDPIQLPATVISKRAVSYGYDVSLFKRLQQAGYPVQVLDTQYRMHPAICRFPSNQFYAGGVKTGEGVEAQTQRPWHADRVTSNSCPCLQHAA